MNSRHALRRLAPLVLALTLVACGQKGPLYLPDGNMPRKVEPVEPGAPVTAAPDRSNEPRKQIH